MADTSRSTLLKCTKIPEVGNCHSISQMVKLSPKPLGHLLGSLNFMSGHTACYSLYLVRLVVTACRSLRNARGSRDVHTRQRGYRTPPRKLTATPESPAHSKIGHLDATRPAPPVPRVGLCYPHVLDHCSRASQCRTLGSPTCPSPPTAAIFLSVLTSTKIWVGSQFKVLCRQGAVQGQAGDPNPGRWRPQGHQGLAEAAWSKE